jgi:hypothetical protein
MRNDLFFKIKSLKTQIANFLGTTQSLKSLQSAENVFSFTVMTKIAICCLDRAKISTSQMLS